MSLTSYRAAPPRDKPLHALSKTGAETKLAHARRRRSIRSGGFLRRQPGPKPLGASGMYQRVPALERPGCDLFGILCRGKSSFLAFIARNPARRAALARSCAKAQPLEQEKAWGIWGNA